MADNEETLGPGGTPTPTPEPGPTPTPQEPAAVAGAVEALKPVADLLGAASPSAELPAATPEPAAPAPAPASRSAPQERIQELTAQKWEERRAREAAEARARIAEETLAELHRLGVGKDAEGQQVPAQRGAPTFTAEQVQEAARQLSAQQEFNRSVDAAVIAGRKVHTDYDESIAGIKKITGPIIPAEFVQAALETGEAAELIYRLGRDTAEADRILSMTSPVRQAVALARMADSIKAERGEADALAVPRVSNAPKPITPRVGGRANAELSLEDMPMEEFMKKRNAEERARRANGKY